MHIKTELKFLSILNLILFMFHTPDFHNLKIFEGDLIFLFSGVYADQDVSCFCPYTSISNTPQIFVTHSADAVE